MLLARLFALLVAFLCAVSVANSQVVGVAPVAPVQPAVVGTPVVGNPV